MLMSRKIVQLILVLFFIAALLVVRMQMLYPLISVPQLHGVSVKTEKPVFNIVSWFDGSFQKKYDNWFNKNVGFRAIGIKTDNQINFSLFRQIDRTRGTTIILGKNNYLYEKGYINSYFRSSKVSQEKIEAIVRKMRCLQDELDKRNIAFILVIGPSKAEVYPEYIPDRYFANSQNIERKTNYQKAVPILDKYKIRYIDGHRRFIELKNSSPYPLFPRGGTHWSVYGAYIVLAELIDRINPLMKDAAMPVSVCRSVNMESPHGVCNDLAKLINIWNRKSCEEPAPYPDLEVQPVEYEKLPEILVVGDSFSQVFLERFPQLELFKKASFLGYYRFHTVYPQMEDLPFERGKAGAERLLKGKDAVIIEIQEAYIPEFGFGFVDDALQALGVDKNNCKEY